MPTTRGQLLTPSELCIIEATVCRILPFGFGRQVFAGPSCIGLSVTIGDVNDGMIAETADGTAGSVWPPPVSTEFEGPPLAPVAKVDGMPGRSKDQGSRFQHMWQCARILLGVWFDLRNCDVAGRVHEFAKVIVRNRRAVHPEAAHPDPMNGGLLRVVCVRSHPEGATRNVDHVSQGGIRWHCDKLHSHAAMTSTHDSSSKGSAPFSTNR